ncbi:MAG: hypothetical protein KDB22_16755 [Planctomycetales bacterium]|nr:hypothetical protein [Planctomycetales bacterium]
MDSSNESQGIFDRIASVLKRVPGGALLFAILPALVLGYMGWFHYGAEHLDRALYALKKENLSLTKQPDWIRSNIVDEVFEQGMLDQITLLDPTSNKKIAHAFEANHWVKSTSHVTKAFGGKVSVDVIYRRPLAMVRVPPSESEELAATGGPAKDHFLPVDADGVVLPTSDFSPNDVLKYFLIIAKDARASSGMTGMQFGDTRITDALKLCSFLDEKSVGIKQIDVVPTMGSGGSSPWLLTLTSADGQRTIVWGHAPGTESRQESSAEAKLERMQEWLTVNADNPARLMLDLRDAHSASQVSLLRP